MTTEIRLTTTGARRLRTTRHPWVYRDHVLSGDAPAGELVQVVDPAGRPLGVAAWSAASKIALRCVRIGGDGAPPDDATLREAFHAAVEARRTLSKQTDAVRLVSSEADGFPGLIVDRYADVAVVQATTWFAERLVPRLLGWLEESFAPRTVVLRNDLAAREHEGLPRGPATVHGAAVEEVWIQEAGVRFGVEPAAGQKTGLFLDQRANRLAAAELVPEGGRVLDAFSYVGGFALHAARRAREVQAVEDSQRAAEALARNASANGAAHVHVTRANAFMHLRELVRAGEAFDVVILDPPAFAKNRRELDGALRGYHEINLRGLRLVRPGGILVTSSCSHHVDEAAFEEVLRAAAADAGRDPMVLRRGSQDVDHPVLLNLPESRYLKCLFLRVP